MGERVPIIILSFEHHSGKLIQLQSEDVRAHVPAPLFLGLPVTTLVDVQCLSGYRIVYLLKPQWLVGVWMGTWWNRKEKHFHLEEALDGPEVTRRKKKKKSTQPWLHIMLKLSWYAFRDQPMRNVTITLIFGCTLIHNKHKGGEHLCTRESQAQSRSMLIREKKNVTLKHTRLIVQLLQLSTATLR